MKKNIAKFFANIRAGIDRFFEACCFSVIAFCFVSYFIIFEPKDKLQTIICALIFTLFLGIPVFTIGQLIIEKLKEYRLNIVSPDERKRKERRHNILIKTVLLLITAAAYFPIRNYQNIYIATGYAGVIAALVICILFLTNTRNSPRIFPFILKNILFNIFVCVIITGGVCLCIFAFHSLIYKFDDVYKTYLISLCFIWCVIFINLCLSALPQKHTNLKIPKIFKIIIQNVMLPVYILLILILYIYLGKILITLSFPSGRVNWFASIASLFFILFIYTLTQYSTENRLSGIFVRYGGFGMIPILIMQFTAMYIRISSYGITSLRYISLVLNIFTVIFVITSVIRGGRYIRYMLPLLAVISLLLTVTPLNAHDIPIKEQTMRLTNLLNKNNMLDGKQIIKNSDITDEDKIKITSAFDYITATQKEIKRPEFIEAVMNSHFEQTFGFAKRHTIKGDYDYTDTKKFQYIQYYSEYIYIDINEYARLYEITSNNYSYSTKTLTIDGQKFEWDITEWIINSYRENNEPYRELESIIFDFYGGKLVLSRLEFELNGEEEIASLYITGYFLAK